MLPRVVILIAISAVLALVTGDKSGNAGILTPEFVVNSTGDGSDLNLGDGNCDTLLLPGDQCSLRAAIESTNATPLGSEITFNIAGAGPHTITPQMPLPPLTKPVLIDGYTQAGATPNTVGLGGGTNAELMIVLDVKDLANGSAGLAVNGGNTTIRGLVIGESNNQGRVNGITVGSNGNQIEGNFFGSGQNGTTLARLLNGVYLLDADNNVVGGSDPADRNLFIPSDPAGTANGNGLGLSGSNNNEILGNLIGTDRTGLIGPSFGVGMRIGAGSSNNAIGSTTDVAARNVISGNQVGALVAEGNTVNNQIAGNFIGVGVDGVTEVGNATGVWLLGSAGNVVGELGEYPGSCTAGCNVIAGNGAGVDISTGADNKVAANHIGLDLNGDPLANDAMGIAIRTDATNSFIQSNIIAHNGGPGVLFWGDAGSGHLLSNNEIFSNEGLGVDIAASGTVGDGVTANDDGDADAGPNDLLNFPVLTSAVSGSTVVEGTYDGVPNTDVNIAFFSNDECDGSGYGEGESPLGTTVVTTDATGHADFSASLTETTAVGSFVTALARVLDPVILAGNTSEFSNCVEVQAAATPTPTPIGQTPTPTPSATPSGQSPTPTLAPGERVWGDLDCSGQAVGADAVKGIRYVANPSSGPSGGCPSPGTVVEVQGFGSLTWGDHDCSGTVLPADQLPLLRYIGGLPQQPSEALCPLVGAVVVVTG